MVKARAKAKGIEFPVSSVKEAELAVQRLGEIERERERVGAELEADTARLNAAAAEKLKPLDDEHAARLGGLRAWATAHRRRLTRGGRRQSVDLQAGRIGWRKKPPSVSIRNADKVIEFLKAGGKRFQRFLRPKVEVDKRELAKHPLAATEIPGVSIRRGEDFYVEPRAIAAVAPPAGGASLDGERAAARSRAPREVA